MSENGNGSQNKRYTKSLNCKLTYEEEHELGIQMAVLMDDADKLKQRIDNTLEGYKGQYKHLMAEATKIKQKLVDHSDYREIEVEEVPDYATNTMRTIRRDTGDQIDERALTYEERQLGLKLEDPLPQAAEVVTEAPAQETPPKTASGPISTIIVSTADLNKLKTDSNLTVVGVFPYLAEIEAGEGDWIRLTDENETVDALIELIEFAAPGDNTGTLYLSLKHDVEEAPLSEVIAAQNGEGTEPAGEEGGTDGLSS